MEQTEFLEVTLLNPSSGVQLAPRNSAVIEVRDNEISNVVDWSFDTSGVSGFPSAYASLPDGKVIQAGCPFTVNEIVRGPIIRLMRMAVMIRRSRRQFHSKEVVSNGYYSCPTGKS